LIVDLAALTNLFRWSLQAALLVLVGAAFLRVMRIDAPTLRHAFWRILLLLCLALPVVQPRLAGSLAAPAAAEEIVTAAPNGIFVSVSPPTSELLRYVRSAMRRWPSWVGYVLAAGVAGRFLWLGIGILRLRRLRKTGEPGVPVGGHDEIGALIRAGAEIRYVSRLGQPVTFGVFRPFVLLPDSFPTLSPAVQRAVLAHELWHVRRRDWAWVLAEEAVRAVLWFNPAIWWLISQVQASREEVVDELTVQVTNARKTYLEALLTFADQPTLFPAAPFARRRHLFHRMLLISREAVMSSRRIVISSVAALAVVITTGWYGASAFPLMATASPQASQTPPRDRRPGEAGPETTRERELKTATATNTATKDAYFELAKLQDARGARLEAEATYEIIRRTYSTDVNVLQELIRAYQQSGRFTEAIDGLESLAALDPNNPQRHQLVAVFYWEKAFKDKSLTPDQSMTYVKAGIASTEKALAVAPDFVEALVYKNILLRMQANMTADPATKQALVAEADVLRNRAIELQKARGSSTNMQFSPAGTPGGAPPPPPPPPPPGGEDPAIQQPIDGVMPVRIGGELKPPRKIRDVKPIYPVEAQDLKIQGVVIIEAVIDTTGNVARGRILRGVAKLDEAALDAVKQWQFEPVLLNGAPVPVVMTVTVNFTLQ
jgi:TonB family protein